MLQMFPKSLSAYSSRTYDRVFSKRKPGNMFPKMEMALCSDLFRFSPQLHHDFKKS